MARLIELVQVAAPRRRCGGHKPTYGSQQPGWEGKAKQQQRQGQAALCDRATPRLTRHRPASPATASGVYNLPSSAVAEMLSEIITGMAADANEALVG